MGDWQDGYDQGIWGLDGIPYGIDSPCWNDNWENELLYKGYMTLQQWNFEGRTVKQGEKGIYLPCAKIHVFRESQTIISDLSNYDNIDQAKKYFETYGEAFTWAKKHPGKIFTRALDGIGYIEK